MSSEAPGSSGSVRRDEVDGVLTLSPSRGPVDGPLRACLMFGVGTVEESLATSGITHLVEHLALVPLADLSFPWNGQVGSVCTRFTVMGEIGQVSAFVTALTSSLSQLDTGRLEAERRVLQLEAGRRTRTSLGSDLSCRFGPLGPGLLDWPEHGLKRLTADEVTAWAQQKFNARNAVLWLSGPVPPDLSLGSLPAGGPEPRKDLPPLLSKPRAYVGENTSTISVSVLSSLHPAPLTGMMVARQRAFDRLRIRDAVSYSVDYTRLRIGRDRAVDHLAADGADDAAPEILRALDAVVSELAEDGPSAAELDALKAQRRLVDADPTTILGDMDSLAERHLLGLADRSIEDIDAEFYDLTVGEVQQAVADARPTLVAVGPSTLDAATLGWNELEAWSSEQIAGGCYRPLLDRETGELVIGEEGVTWIHDDTHRRTVRWDRAEACFTWDNGERSLLGRDGIFVGVIPWNWLHGESLTALVDENVPGQLRIPMGGTMQRGDSKDDPRWLAALTALMERGVKTDLVVRTDGLLLLPSDVARRGAASQKARLDELHSIDPQRALSEERGARWVPVDRIRGARPKNRVLEFLRPRMRSALDSTVFSIDVFTDAPKPLRLEARSKKSAKILENAVRNMLGERYGGPLEEG